MGLEGKVSLVTGASGGIGSAIACELARLGSYTILTDIDEGGASTAEKIGGIFLRADLADSQEVGKLTRRALDVAGHVDILINNAGLQHVFPVEEFPEEIWMEMVQIMMIAPFQLIKGMVPGMKSRCWGRIINVASVHGLVASPYKSAYVAAKHGLVGLTKAVALEVGELGITVNAICPSYVRTKLVENQVAAQAQNLGISEEDVVGYHMLGPAAIKRFIEPQEVAEVVSFLASDSASSITGTATTMDLGWTAR